MLSQYKSFSQSKKSPVLSQRPNVFCSTDDEDEEETDYSKFLEMKGNSRPVFFSVLGHAVAWTFYWVLVKLQWHACIFLCDFWVNVLTACLKSLPQRIRTPGSSSTSWLLLWQKEDLSWRRKLRRTTKTIQFSRKSKGRCGSIGLLFSCSVFTHLFSCYLSPLGFYLIRAAWSISTTIKKLQSWRRIWRELRLNQIMVKITSSVNNCLWADFFPPHLVYF